MVPETVVKLAIDALAGKPTPLTVWMSAKSSRASFKTGYGHRTLISSDPFATASATVSCNRCGVARAPHISRRETGHSGRTKYQMEDGARHSLRVSGAVQRAAATSLYKAISTHGLVELRLHFLCLF